MYSRFGLRGIHIPSDSERATVAEAGEHTHTVTCAKSYSGCRFRRSMKTFLFGQPDHGTLWTPLTAPFRNTLTYLLIYTHINTHRSTQAHCTVTTTVIILPLSQQLHEEIQCVKSIDTWWLSDGLGITSAFGAQGSQRLVTDCSRCTNTSIQKSKKTNINFSNFIRAAKY